MRRRATASKHLIRVETRLSAKEHAMLIFIAARQQTTVAAIVRQRLLKFIRDHAEDLVEKEGA